MTPQRRCTDGPLRLAGFLVRIDATVPDGELWIEGRTMRVGRLVDVERPGWWARVWGSLRRWRSLW